MFPAVSRTTMLGVPVTANVCVDSTVYRGPLTDPTHAPISEPISATSRPSSTKKPSTPPISHQTHALLRRRRGAHGGGPYAGGAEPYGGMPLGGMTGGGGDDRAAVYTG